MENFTFSTESIGRSEHRSAGPRHAAGSGVSCVADKPGDGDDRAVPVVFEALSDDGPFHRLTDKEARRYVISAYFYYACLAAIVLVAIVWH